MWLGVNLFQNKFEKQKKNSGHYRLAYCEYKNDVILRNENDNK